MPISVVCPGCKKRFSVSEKFAGQKGPCPKCKSEITIPKLEDQVVVHGPQDAGPKDTKGRSLSKPILREETRFSVPVAIGIAVASLVILIIALVMRGSAPPMLLAIGALLLAPPLVLGGYTFLRNDELEAYYGSELWVRVLACSAVYALLWGVYWWIPWVWELDGGFQITQLVFVVPPFVLAGGFAAFASLDLDYMMGLVHYGFYLIVTGLLCFIMQVPLFAPAG